MPVPIQTQGDMDERTISLVPMQPPVSIQPQDIYPMIYSLSDSETGNMRSDIECCLFIVSCHSSIFSREYCTNSAIDLRELSREEEERIEEGRQHKTLEVRFLYLKDRMHVYVMEYEYLHSHRELKFVSLE